VTTKRVLTIGLAIGCLSGTPLLAEDTADRLAPETFAGLKLRNIGPALMSGRIADVVVDPNDPSTWYVAVASGGVWKTSNSGTTWTPIFDDYGSYSIGCIAIDPRNPQVLWLGTGENASQRSVGYGDGVYKSLDGGGSWERVGLEASEHIGKILIDPRDSDVLYVAAQGPLWAPGGDRGLYKTDDGGRTWTAVLEVSENTGITDIAMDPRDPEVLYAASYQRRRHVGVLVAGGPESAVYKSTDGGTSWKKLTRGLPEADVGRIALAVSPQRPDVVYALIAAARDASGFYASVNRGESWEKRSDYVVVDPQYYGEIYPDPHAFDRIYAADVWMHVTDDGGRSFHRLGSEFKHVDNHAVVFDPADPDYLMVGTDGGLYESWDRGETWRFVDNLPVTQFYRVGLDQAEPFYNVYGGTQDNSTQGGPSRTTSRHGIRNSDWFLTLGGDGFQVRIDPEDPNILYCMYQYAGIVRYDKASGEIIDIQPQPGPAEAPLRWHWDSPLVISPHSHTRLYFAANRLFRSEDRGNTWTAVSPDLSRGFDRNERVVMGRVWGVDAVWKNVFTSPFGTIVSFDESPLEEGLLYAGTDDGLIQVSEDAGETWRKVESFRGVPDLSYVADVVASRHDPNTVYAVFNNHKEGDFEPYILRSDDRGSSWTAIAGDLPERYVVWSLVEDHQQPELLFAGTELGVFFTVDGGRRWIELQGGVPTIAFRDLEIQRRESDLVAASFGRGFFVLDDYSPLREVTPERLGEEAVLFPVKDAWMFIEERPLGGSEKGTLGHTHFTAPNPPFGAVFTFYLRDELKSRRQQRQEAEAERIERGESILYPSWEALRAEDREQFPATLLVVTDEDGDVVRRIEGPTTPGFHRVAWDLRYPSVKPVGQSKGDDDSAGSLVAPGTYSVRLARRVDGIVEPLGAAQRFRATPLGNASLPAPDRRALAGFHRKTARLQRAVLAAQAVAEATADQLVHLKTALDATAVTGSDLYERVRTLELRLADLRIELTGDPSISTRAELQPPSIADRVERITRSQWTSTSAPTTTQQEAYTIAAQAFVSVLQGLRTLVEQDLAVVSETAEAAGAPWSPGRGLPSWPPEPDP
jgi:photosystem II stability/assembly factor-like uncharacterized protein